MMERMAVTYRVDQWEARCKGVPDARFELASTRSKGGCSTAELIGMPTKMSNLVTGSVSVPKDFVLIRRNVFLLYGSLVQASYV